MLMVKNRWCADKLTTSKTTVGERSPVDGTSRQDEVGNKRQIKNDKYGKSLCLQGEKGLIYCVCDSSMMVLVKWTREYKNKLRVNPFEWMFLWSQFYHNYYTVRVLEMLKSAIIKYPSYRKIGKVVGQVNIKQSIRHSGCLLLIRSALSTCLSGSSGQQSAFNWNEIQQID